MNSPMQTREFLIGVLALLAMALGVALLAHGRPPPSDPMQAIGAIPVRPTYCPTVEHAP